MADPQQSPTPPGLYAAALVLVLVLVLLVILWLVGAVSFLA
jgi:hypothetical protein